MGRWPMSRAKTNMKWDLRKKGKLKKKLLQKDRNGRERRREGKERGFQKKNLNKD